MLNNKNPIYILGAGPSGLAAAYTLTKQGRKVVVVDRENKVGGLSKSISYNGFILDYGSHVLATDTPLIEEMFNEILGDEQIFLSSKTSFYWRGCYFSYPPKVTDVLKELGLQKSIKIVFSFIYSKIFLNNFKNNYAEKLISQYGKMLFESFFKDYVEKVWGVPCSKLSANCVAGRTNGFFREVISRLFSNWVQKNDKYDYQFRYPKHGLGKFYEGIANYLYQQQQDIILNTEVIEIRYEGEQVTQVVLRDCLTGKKFTCICQAVISSIPLTLLLQQMQPSVSDKLIETCKNLKFRNTILVYVIINGVNLFSEQCLYINDPDIPIVRITNYANWSNKKSSDQKQTPLCCEYTCGFNDSIWKLSDSQLMSNTELYLTSLGLLKNYTIASGFTVRLPYTNPIYSINYEIALEDIQSYLQQFKNLRIVGRGGSFSYSDQDRVLLQGVMAAKAILE